MQWIPDHTNTCRNDTTIRLYDFLIQEPVTTLTDLCITLCCWYIFFFKSKRIQKHQVTQLYRYFIFIMGFATLFGGIFGHALCYRFGAGFKLPGWILSMTAVMLCERAAILHAGKQMPVQITKFFSSLNIAELILMITVTCSTLNFFFVELHAFYGLLIVTGIFELYNYSKTRSEASLRILCSVAFSSIAAVVHIWQLSPYRWFNALDLAHSIMCISIFILFSGIKRIIFDQGNL